MRRFSALFLTVLLLAAPSFSSPVEPVADLEQIHSSSVFVRAPDGSSGSGSVFKSRTGEYLILSAAHVVWDSQGPATVLQSILRDGKKIGEYAVLADVLVASHPYHGYDIVVLKPRDVVFTNAVSFYAEKATPKVGTPIVHCGSIHGAWLERSITFGHIAALNRYRSEKQRYPLDFSTATALPGSSGGGVFLASSGALIGFVDEWEPEFDSVNFFVPVRSILEFLRAEKILD